MPRVLELLCGDPGHVAPGVLDAGSGGPFAVVLRGAGPEDLSGEAVDGYGGSLGWDAGQELLRLGLEALILGTFDGGLLRICLCLGLTPGLLNAPLLGGLLRFL